TRCSQPRGRSLRRAVRLEARRDMIKFKTVRGWVLANLVCITLLLLAACGGAPPGQGGGVGDSGTTAYISEQDIHLKDGRIVTCLIYKQGYAGGLSCDW